MQKNPEWYHSCHKSSVRKQCRESRIHLLYHVEFLVVSFIDSLIASLIDFLVVYLIDSLVVFPIDFLVVFLFDSHYIFHWLILSLMTLDVSLINSLVVSLGNILADLVVDLSVDTLVDSGWQPKSLCKNITKLTSEQKREWTRELTRVNQSQPRVNQRQWKSQPAQTQIKPKYFRVDSLVDGWAGVELQKNAPILIGQVLELCIYI